MTNREFFENVVNGVSNAEMVEKANELIVALDSKNAKRKVANATKRSEVNEPLIARAIDILKGQVCKASDIATALEISTSKATVIAKAVPNVVIGTEKVKGGRVVKTYTLD